MASSEKALEEQLTEAGNGLLNPPSSIDELFRLLENIGNLLTKVEQEPSTSIQDALLPSMKALISDELLKHSDTDVKVSVTYCLTEISRITAPDNPYNDEKMKDIFGLTIAAFGMLSHESGHSYAKAVSILDTVAKVRSCLVMLDLECDEMIVEMFRQFLKLIRSNHQHVVYLSMETIMTNVLEESEEISSDLLSPLLDSVRKENQDGAPASFKLGENVLKNCATKLKPYLMEAVQSTGLDDYAPIVASICQTGSDELKHSQCNDALEHLVIESTMDAGTNLNESSTVKKKLVPDASVSETTRADDGSFESVTTVISTAPTKNDDTAIAQSPSKKSRGRPAIKSSKTISVKGDIEPDNSDCMKGEILRKRGRKPNSLMNPEEGYDDTWIGSRGKARKGVSQTKSDNKETENIPSENPKSSTITKDTSPSLHTITDEVNVLPSNQTPNTNKRKRGRPRKTPALVNQDADQVEEKFSKSEDVSLTKTAEVSRKLKSESKHKTSSEKFSKSEGVSLTKTPEFSRKLKSESKRKTSSPCIVSENEGTFSQDSGEKLLKNLNVKVKRESMNGDKSIDKKDAKKSNAPASGSNVKQKIRKSTTKVLDEEDNLAEFLRTKIKMKTAAKKAKDSKTAFSGGELVGWRIKVWWPMDKKFYEGIIHSYDPLKKKHKVLYGDGDEENLNLDTQRYELIGDEVIPDTDVSSPQVRARDNSKDGSSSEMQKSRKRKRKTGSAMDAKSAVSLRRSKGSDMKSKVEDDSAKSTQKPSDGSMLKKPSCIDESVENSQTEKGGGKKSIILRFSKLNSGVEIICRD